MKRYKSDAYIFATAYIKSKEKYMLTQEKAERMLDAKNPDDALKVLYEMNYGEGLEDIPAAEFEKLLASEIKKSYEMILSLTPEKEYFMHFLYPNDYHNVKTLLKAEFSGASTDELFMEGTIPIAELTELVHSRNYYGMREEMAKGIQEVVDTFGLTQDPQVIDLILDKACYKEVNSEVSKLKNDYVKGYVALKTDAINLKSFIRAKEMNKSWDFFSKIFIEGGKIPERVFVGNYDEAPEQFADRLLVYNFQGLLQESAAILKETGRFTALEKLCDNLLMDYVKESKYVAFGVEPLVGFLAAKESETKIIRIIMAGKLAGLSAELIRERVRDTYV